MKEHLKKLNLSEELKNLLSNDKNYNPTIPRGTSELVLW